MKRLLLILLVISLVCTSLGGCGKKNEENVLINDDVPSGPVEVDFSQNDADMFTDRDTRTEYDEKNCIKIELQGNTAVASSNSVNVSEGKVTITQEATYVISGTLDDGMIIVNAPEDAKLQLVFNGVNITSKTSAPLYIIEADKVFVTLTDGTDNVLSSGGSFVAIDDNNIDAAVFSKQDLTFNGSGSLTVRSPAGHGIVSKDDLVITGGTYNITSASHGLDANDSIRIKDAAITVDAGKDGIHAENTDDTSLGFVYLSSGNIKIEAEGDGISSGSYMQIENGDINVLAGGGSKNGSKDSSDSYGGFMGGRPGGMRPSTSTSASESSTSMKGIKAAGGMLISNGSITVDSADDGVHSDVSIVINGGTFQIATGDDGIHAEQSLNVTSGNIKVNESYEGLEALNIVISGGEISVVASDDGLNAAGGIDGSGMTGGRDGKFGGGMSSSKGSIVIAGGSVYIKMSGDGIDANGTLSITGGNVVVSGATSGDTAILDFDSVGEISGGTFIGTGALGMPQNFSSSTTQGVMMVPVSGNAGAQIKLSDSNGNVILTHDADRAFSNVIISHSSIKKGETYTLSVGSSSTTVKMTDTVYGAGGGMGGGMGGPGGMTPGGRR